MNPSNGESTQAITVDYDFPQAPEKVWRALTEPALLAAWLMPNNIRPVVGHRFTFQAPPTPGWDGVAHCEVLAVEPQRLLSYRWGGGSQDLKGYGHQMNTVVTWALTPSATGGTHLRLVHAGFTAEDTFAFQTMGHGWRTHTGQSLARVLAEVG